MTIEFRCEYCDKLLRTSDEKAGLVANCPGCRAELTVPNVDSEDELDFEAEPTVNRRRKKCPLCGAPVQIKSGRCGACGEMLEFDESDYTVSSTGGNLQAHRGVLLMVLSILSWVFSCLLFAIAVWILAAQDLKSMEEGTMDPEGEGLTKAAKIISMVNVIVTLLFVFGCISLMLLGIIAQP